MSIQGVGPGGKSGDKAGPDEFGPHPAVIATNVIIFIVSNLIFVPIEAYYAKQIHNNRESNVIAKRKPGILMISVVSAMLFYFLFQTALLILASLGVSVLELESQIIYYVIAPFWYISWFTFICRLWLLYFTVNHSVATINNKWQEVVNVHHKSTNNWLIYKHSWGTWNALKKKLVVYAIFTYIVDVLLSILLLAYPDDVWALIFTLGIIKALASTLLPMAFLVWMVYGISKCHYHDNIGLGRELRFCTYGYVLILVIRLADYTLSTFAEADGYERQVMISFVVAIEFFLWKCVGFGINLLQTRWPLITFEKVMNRYSSRHLGKLAHVKTLKNVETSNQQSKNEQLRMRDILNNEKSFDLFMRHCGMEHCTECVLSLIEIIQYKQEIYKKLSSQGRTDQVVADCQIEDDTFTLPVKCPKSDIVFDPKLNFKGIARKLYKKYIEVGSDWEINISYHARKRLNRIFENEETWDSNKDYDDIVKLFDVFEKCITEMTSIIRAAFQRFKQSETFLVLQNKSKSLKKVSASYKDQNRLVPEEEQDEDGNGRTDNIDLADIDSTTPMTAQHSGSAASAQSDENIESPTAE